MSNPTSDQMVTAAARCHSAVFSDICDQLGLRSQTLPPRLRRLSGTGTVVGLARTFTTVAVTEIPERHYGGEIDFIDSLRPGDFPIGRVLSEVAGWGELFSAAATSRGAVGLVIDGLVRDLDQIRDLGFPIHGTGVRPTDALGRLALGSPDELIDIDGVEVVSGDLVVADSDGVTVVPAAVIEEVVEKALEKASIERSAKDLLLAGGTLAEMWERYRVL